MFDKSKKAIANLRRLLTELDAITNVLNGNTWKASLKDTLNLNIGPESSLSKRLDDIYFSTKISRTDPSEYGMIPVYEFDISKKDNFKDLIQNAIKHIESNGIYMNESRKNFLNGFNDTHLISGIVVGIGIILGIGNYFGKFEKEREIIECDAKNKEIEKKYQDSFNENEVIKKQLEEQILRKHLE